MKLSRLATTLAATACALAIGLVSSASAAPPAPPGPQPGASAHSAGADGIIKPLALSQGHLENSYVPIAPCRIADTSVIHAPLQANATRNFNVRGSFGFAPQGGLSGGCGIPTTATSVNATVNALKSTPNRPHPGYLLGYPTGGAVPTANFMAFIVGGNSSNPTFTLRTSGEPSLTIKSLGGITDVAIDIFGYYVPPIEGLIYTGDNNTPGSGFVYSGSPRILSVTWIQTGIADVTMDRDVSYCTPVAGGYYDLSYSANARAFNGNKIRVFSLYTDLTTHATTRINYYVYLAVFC